MPDNLTKTEFDNLPSQQTPAGSQDPAPAESAQFNPEGEIEDIFEGTEKPDKAGSQAGFKVKSKNSDPNPEVNTGLSKAGTQPAGPAGTNLLSKNIPGKPISKPALPKLAQEDEYDDDSDGGKKRYFIIGIVALVAIGLFFVYWFFIRQAPADEANGTELGNENTQQEAEVSNPQAESMTEDGENDIMDNPEPAANPVQPGAIDSDQDGITDEEELEFGTNRLKADSDSDGLFDREELKVYLTDPNDPDTDNDGYTDGEEVVNGFNPKGTGSFLPPIR